MIIFHEFAMRLPKNIPVLYLFYFIWYSPFLSNLCLLGNEIICSISLWLEQIKCLTLFKLLKHCLKMMKAPLCCSHVSLKQLTRKNWMWSVGEKFLEGKAVFKKFWFIFILCKRSQESLPARVYMKQPGRRR